MVTSQSQATAERGELPAVLTVEQVRQFLNISRPMAYELCHKENFPKLRIGRTIRIPRDSFFQWLENETKRGGNGSKVETPPPCGNSGQSLERSP